MDNRLQTQQESDQKYWRRVELVIWWNGWIWGMVAGLIIGVATHIFERV
jgi:hypothetical protein